MSSLHRPRLPQEPAACERPQEAFASAAELIADTSFGSVVFPGFDREHVSVQGALFSGCRFPGCTLRASQLADVVFRNCDLSNVRFSDCGFHRVEFIECKLVGADLSESTFFHVLFQGCKAELMNLSEGKFRFVRFSDSLLRSASLDRCSFERVEFSACDLTLAELHRTPLRGVSLADSRIDGIRVVEVVSRELKGLKVTRLQASELARMLGIEIEE